MLASICHRCPHVQPPPYAGKCACLYDPAKPVDILERVETRHCPAGKFKLGFGDTLALLFHWFGIARPWKKMIERVTGEPCGCEDHQKALNQALPRK